MRLSWYAWPIVVVGELLDGFCAQRPRRFMLDPDGVMLDVERLQMSAREEQHKECDLRPHGLRLRVALRRHH
jgi:hypothetical protein